jgi:hypothetical protein
MKNKAPRLSPEWFSPLRTPIDNWPFRTSPYLKANSRILGSVEVLYFFSFFFCARPATQAGVNSSVCLSKQATSWSLVSIPLQNFSMSPSHGLFAVRAVGVSKAISKTIVRFMVNCLSLLLRTSYVDPAPLPNIGATLLMDRYNRCLHGLMMVMHRVITRASPLQPRGVEPTNRSAAAKRGGIGGRGAFGWRVIFRVRLKLAAC